MRVQGLCVLHKDFWNIWARDQAAACSREVKHKKKKHKTEVQGIIEAVYRHVPQAKSHGCMPVLPLTVAGREERFAGL